MSSTMKNKQSSSTIITIGLLIIVIVNLLLNYMYRHQLYKMGQQLIAQFQLSQNTLLTLIFLIPTILIDPSVIIAISFTLIILIKQKQSSFNTVIWILLNAFLACLLKAYYSDPRPFWTLQEIQSIGLYCPVQYGNPSGHSWFSVIIGLGFLVDKYGPGINNRNLYISLLLIIIVPMSRMYLGAHSLNQVIQGVCLGLVMVVFYQCCGLRQTISQYLINFSTNKNNRWKKLTIVMHLLYIIAFLMNHNRQQSQQYLEQQSKWTINIIEQCHHTPTSGKLNFTMLMLNSLILNFTTGIAYGYGEIYQSQRGQVYLRGNWLINQQRYTLLCGYVMFVGIQLMLLLIAFIPMGIVVCLIGMNDYVLFIGGNISVLIAGYLYTSRTYKILFEKQVIREQIQ